MSGSTCVASLAESRLHLLWRDRTHPVRGKG